MAHTDHTDRSLHHEEVTNHRRDGGVPLTSNLEVLRLEPR